MMPAAEVIPLRPNGAKSDRLSEFQPDTPTATNSTSTASLIITIAALTFADSLAPRMSNDAHSTTRTMAGRLITPSASGAFDSDLGIVKPKRLSSSSLRYCDQPTATAAAETPYSSSRHAATTIATPSPMVA
jgi:hypothetical protein